MLSRQLGYGWYPWQTKPDLQLVKDSSLITVAHLSQNAISALYMVIAGFVLDKPTLGQFNLADKLIWPFRQIIGAGFQATYPQVVRVFMAGQDAGRAFLLKLARVFFGLGVVAVAGLGLLAPWVVMLVNKGVAAPEAAYYLRLMGPLAFLIAVQVPFAQFLVATHLKRSFTVITMVAAVLSYVLNVWLVQDYGVVGIIVVITATEGFIVLALLYQWWAHRAVKLGING
jgi:O-antigen/teichoic acid export membrane protein